MIHATIFCTVGFYVCLLLSQSLTDARNDIDEVTLSKPYTEIELTCPKSSACSTVRKQVPMFNTNSFPISSVAIVADLSVLSNFTMKVFVEAVNMNPENSERARFFYTVFFNSKAFSIKLDNFSSDFIKTHGFCNAKNLINYEKINSFQGLAKKIHRFVFHIPSPATPHLAKTPVLTVHASFPPDAINSFDDYFKACQTDQWHVTTKLISFTINFRNKRDHQPVVSVLHGDNYLTVASVYLQLPKFNFYPKKSLPSFHEKIQASFCNKTAGCIPILLIPSELENSHNELACRSIYGSNYEWWRCPQHVIFESRLQRAMITTKRVRVGSLFASEHFELVCSSYLRNYEGCLSNSNDQCQQINNYHTYWEKFNVAALRYEKLEGSVNLKSFPVENSLDKAYRCILESHARFVGFRHFGQLPQKIAVSEFYLVNGTDYVKYCHLHRHGLGATYFRNSNSDEAFSEIGVPYTKQRFWFKLICQLAREPLRQEELRFDIQTSFLPYFRQQPTITIEDSKPHLSKDLKLKVKIIIDDLDKIKLKHQMTDNKGKPTGKSYCISTVRLTFKQNPAVITVYKFTTSFLPSELSLFQYISYFIWNKLL